MVDEIPADISKAVDKAIPTWVKLLIAAIVVGIVIFICWRFSSAVGRYMADHDAWGAEVSSLTKDRDMYKTQAAARKACADLAQQVRDDAHDIATKAQSSIQQNVDTHKEIQDAIAAAPPSDDGPPTCTNMAPIWNDAFGRMYPASQAAAPSGNSTGGSTSR